MRMTNTERVTLHRQRKRLGQRPVTVLSEQEIDREFVYELVQPVARRPGRDLQAALDQLTEAGLLFSRGTAPHASYLFKHALVQDAAYSTLLRGRRQELHARVEAVHRLSDAFLIGGNDLA
jgi:hypothetical protein